ncbi:uncharacterized protein DNG_00089 [Cephalotrichum gorgonifer]|uniref:F-box domain-containing protein n=1 Tax=Cephalotrichum gorgonifer TaxID=2041049 RepID=A0AAE8MNA7_9PEZI|nr:uncharacterized protein DNG_00089 [Cephalotrichum gorgonifer]
MSTATHQALLAVPECLEMVLQELDPTTLLVSAQRVCKTWRDTIAGSQRLQRKLFFAPSDGRTDGARIRNPLLADALPAFFNTDLRKPTRSDSVLEGLRSADDQDAPLLRKGASWRRMYPEYPVTFKLGVIEARGPSQLSFYSGVLDVPGGITAGKLFDVAYTMNLGRRLPESWFAVYWREKERDPPLHAYSYKCGNEEVALSRMEGDIKIVVYPKYHAKSKHGPESVEDVDARYAPADYEFSRVSLAHTNSQDWFG